MRPALRHWAPLILAVAGAALYLLIRPASTDLAAHLYRAGLFRRQGFAVWDGAWYGGHHVPGYSVLFPPFEAYIRPRVAGAIAAVAAAALFAGLARDHWGERGALAAAWFGAGSATLLLTGRFAFAAGLAVALAALLLWERRGLGAGIAGAVLTGLTSPVAALFLALSAVSTRRRAGVALAAAALAPALVVTLAFPEGGTEPFSFGSLWPVLLLAAGAVLLLPGEERALRTAAGLYGLLCLGAFLVPSPLGSNVVRLAPLVAGPLAAGALVGRRPRLLAALALPLLVWQWSNAVRDVQVAAHDPSTRGGYYTGVLAFLERAERADGPARVEIPFTRLHWEAALVAPHVPLARGWERQLDRKYNAVFTRPLTERSYRAWLSALAVRWIALPDVRLDYTATAEAKLVRSEPPWLRPVYRDAHWRVWEVRGATPLATGAARATALGNDDVRLDAHRAGNVRLRVRFTPYWALAAGRGCVAEGPGGFTRLTLRGPGRVHLVTRFSPARAISSGPRCR